MHIWGCPAEAWLYRPHERKLDLRAISHHLVGYVKCSRGYKFFEIGNARFLEENEFGKEVNIGNVIFEEKPIIDSDSVLIPINIQDITLVIENNVQTNIN